ncbi:MAG: hypothetical protein ACE5L7_05105 [Candidatus Aminicenantales bacterium]
MKEIFDILSEKEKRILGLVTILLIIPVVFLLFVAGGEKRAYFRALDSLTAKEKTYQDLVSKNEETQKEWLRWQEAVQDIKDIREKYFYKDNDIFEVLRSDLEELFNQSGIQVSRKNYDYAELKKGNLKKVIIAFDWKGSYFALKRFLHSVEKFSKFLVVEKIDFLNIDSQTGMLELKIALAGYYEK